MLFAIVFLPLAAAAIVACLPANARRLSAALAGACALTIVATLGLAAPALFAGALVIAMLGFVGTAALARFVAGGRLLP